MPARGATCADAIPSAACPRAQRACMGGRVSPTTPHCSVRSSSTRRSAGLDHLYPVLSPTYVNTMRLRLLLDYDGTLVPLARSPELAAPDDELLCLLEQLADAPGIQLDIVSGRSHETLERWFGDLPIALWAEHGFWHRSHPGQAWERGPRGASRLDDSASSRFWNSLPPARRGRMWRSRAHRWRGTIAVRRASSARARPTSCACCLGISSAISRLKCWRGRRSSKFGGAESARGWWRSASRLKPARARSSSRSATTGPMRSCFGRCRPPV